MELSFLIDKYLKYLEQEKNASRYTIKDYKHYLANFSDYCSEKKVSRIEDLNLEHIQSYKLYLSPFKKSTQNYFLIALRNFIWYLKNQKGLTLINSEDIRLSKQKRDKPKVLEEGLLEKLLNGPSQSDLAGLRDRAILAVLSATGIKISEASSLNRGSFSFSNQTISTSGKKERILDIPSSVSTTLENYLKRRKDTFKPLFIRFKGTLDPSNDGEKMRLTDRSIERMVKKYGTTPQILRHSFAAALLDRGEKLHIVQKVMGHTNKASTQIYERLIRESA